MQNKYIIHAAHCDEDYTLISKFLINHDVLGKEKGNEKFVRDELCTEYQALRLIGSLAEEPRTVVAYAEFADYPKIPALPSDCWLHWLKHHFCIPLPINVANTIFLNTIEYINAHPDVIKELVMKAFLSQYRIRYILTVQYPNSTHTAQKFFDELDKFAIPYHSKDYDIGRCENGPIVHIIDEEFVIDKLSFRWALPGDNDDVMKILDIDRPDIRAQFGEFYIAEQILRGKQENVPVYIIIGEIMDQTVGFMWLSETPDVRELLENFEFESYGNLVKYTNSARHNCESIKVEENRLSPNAQMFTDAGLSDLEEKTILGGLMANDSNVSVISTAKFRIQITQSNEHIEIDAEDSDETTFFERENVFAKFRYIYEKPRHESFYVAHRRATLEIYYDVPENKNIETCTLNDASNVFELNLCTVTEDFSISRLSLFLCCAFSGFPDRDYCLIRISNNEEVSPIMHELLKYFLPVGRRPGCIIAEDIFIIHRSTLFGELWLHELRESDVADVNNFLKACNTDQYRRSSHEYEETVKLDAQADFQKVVMAEFIEDVLTNRETNLSFFVIRCGDSSNPPEENAIVGFIVLSQFTDLDKLHRDYLTMRVPQMDNLRAQIHMLKLHSFFHVWSDQIFRALAVKTVYRKFYYLTTNTDCSLDNDLITNMMPMEPRRHKKYWFGYFNNLKDEKIAKLVCNLPTFHYFDDDINVYLSNLRPIKFMTNKKKIVIIGFSDYCKALLRSLVFDWNTPEYLQKYCCIPDMDITVIVQAGIVQAEYDRNFVCNICANPKFCYTYHKNCISFVRDCTRRMDLRYFVQFVYGRASHINREKKAVVMRGGCEIEYQKLILMCHTDFGHSKPDKQSRPSNYIEINHRLDKIILYHKVQTLLGQRENYKILIYGSNLRVLECINFLVSHRVNPRFITWVIPRKDMHCKDFNNPERDRFMEELFNIRIASLGIHMLKYYKFSEFKCYHSHDFIHNVTFVTESTKPLYKTLECDLYISFEEVFIDSYDRKVFEGSGIHFQNKFIVVNEKYQTNDPHIYAMGKYIIMNPEPNYQYGFVNEKEAVEKLIYILDLSNRCKIRYEPRFSKPRFFTVQLIMKTTLVKLTIPKRYLHTDKGFTTDTIMTTIESGDFCRVRLAANKCVSEILIVTKKRISLDFLEHFCGRHESLLNNLYLHWQEDAIGNFLEFFMKPWTELIMHEAFEGFQTTNRRHMMPILERMFTKLPKDLHLRNELLRNSQHKRSSRILQDDIVGFIREHREEFINAFALPEDFAKNIYPN